MSLQVEKLEKNMAKLTIEVSAEELEKAIEGAYQKNKNKISIPGFRKGKAPRKMIEQMYGKSVFYEDAANALIPDAYDKALEECDRIFSEDRCDPVRGRQAFHLHRRGCSEARSDSWQVQGCEG